MGRMRSTFKILVGNLKAREHLEDLGVYGRVMLKWILKKYDMTVSLGLTWLWIWTSGGLNFLKLKPLFVKNSHMPATSNKFKFPHRSVNPG
jgi:hypothetical protein